VAVRDLPRFPLAALPTPLQRALRLERELGAPPLWVKRDDLTGFALAGNKARKLEFLVADALAHGCDLLLTGGGPGSNHCQAAAAAAAAAGLASHLVLFGGRPGRPPANLRLALGFGAEVTFTGDDDRASVDAGLARIAGALIAAGRRPYLIPRGGASPMGAVGYALAADELAEQLARAGVEPGTVLVATGSCGTQAGLVAGWAASGSPWRLVGASVSRPPKECRDRILQLAAGCAELLGTPAPRPDRIEVRDARGPGYRRPWPVARDVARVAARTEGLLLDPVFTAKALAALTEMLRDGVDGPIVFIHTGGLASLFDEEGIG
jgi:D-cysteine desulfhydrase